VTSQSILYVCITSVGRVRREPCGETSSLSMVSMIAILCNKRLASRFYQFNGALLNRPASCLDYMPTGRHLLVVPVQYPDRSIFSRTAPNGEASKRPSGRPPPGVGTVQASRNCSPTSGAAGRYWISSQTQTSAGRPAHW